MKKTLLISLTLLVSIANCAEDGKKAGRRARLAAVESNVKATEAELKETKRQNINADAKQALKDGKIAEARRLIKKSLKLAPQDNATGYLMASQAFSEDKLKYLTEAASSSQSFMASSSKAEALKQMKNTNSISHIASVIKKYTDYLSARAELTKQYKESKALYDELKKLHKNGTPMTITENFDIIKAKKATLDNNLDATIKAERERSGNKATFDLLISDLINGTLNENLNVYL